MGTLSMQQLQSFVLRGCSAVDHHSLDLLDSSYPQSPEQLGLKEHATMSSGWLFPYPATAGFQTLCAGEKDVDPEDADNLGAEQGWPGICMACPQQRQPREDQSGKVTLKKGM
ncbi:uncharacterized protein LOC144333621 [Macaca mulatta]